MYATDVNVLTNYKCLVLLLKSEILMYERFENNYRIKHILTKDL